MVIVKILGANMKIGISTPSNEIITEELFKEMSEAGANYIEISVNDSLLQKIDYDKLKEWADKWQITLWSFHLPFYPFDKIDISMPSLAKDTIKYLRGYIDKASAIGIDKFIIHASGEPINEEDRPLRIETAKRSLFELCEYAKQKGARILVEDLPRTCLGRNSSDILELLSAHPDLDVCFDTNHLLGEDYVKFIHSVGKNIKSLHVSDYDFKDERHWLPGEGKIDWQRLTHALDEVGYNGPWLYEIDFDAPWTISRDRRLCPSDFVENASVLLEGKTPASLGTPREDL